MKLVNYTMPCFDITKYSVRELSLLFTNNEMMHRDLQACGGCDIKLADLLSDYEETFGLKYTKEQEDELFDDFQLKNTTISRDGHPARNVKVSLIFADKGNNTAAIYSQLKENTMNKRTQVETALIDNKVPGNKWTSIIAFCLSQDADKENGLYLWDAFDQCMSELREEAENDWTTAAW